MAKTVHKSKSHKSHHHAPKSAAGKRHHEPSAYNKFMREELKRVKREHPDLEHTKAFGVAAKRWHKSAARRASLKQ